MYTFIWPVHWEKEHPIYNVRQMAIMVKDSEPIREASSFIFCKGGKDFRTDLKYEMPSTEHITEVITKD